jgi:hypothetical protein
MVTSLRMARKVPEFRQKTRPPMIPSLGKFKTGIMYCERWELRGQENSSRFIRCNKSKRRTLKGETQISHHTHIHLILFYSTNSSQPNLLYICFLPLACFFRIENGRKRFIFFVNVLTLRRYRLRSLRDDTLMRFRYPRGGWSRESVVGGSHGCGGGEVTQPSVSPGFLKFVMSTCWKHNTFKVWWCVWD